MKPNQNRTAHRIAGRIERRMAAHRHRIVAAGRPWIVGFSHGPDSTLLLRLLHDLATPELIAVHVDHGLRAASGAEAGAARRYATELGLRCEVVQVRPAKPGESAARHVRHLALEAAARRHGAAAVVLGHHRDDVFETLLHRLCRGTGPLGLASIRELRQLDARGPWLFRPMLGVPRRAIETAVRALDLPHVVDPTNADPGLTARNRIRHELLPALRRHDPHDYKLRALLREARRLDAAVGHELNAVEPATELPLEVLATLSPWAREKLFAAVLKRLGHPEPPRRHLGRLCALVEARPGTVVEARGRWRAQRYGTRVTVC